MKKGEGDVFKQFRDSFSKLEGHFHVLEQRVPVEVQMEYFKNSEKVRRSLSEYPSVDMDNHEDLVIQLNSEDIEIEEKKRILTMLAISKSVKSYRVLEEYARKPNPEVANWAYMALMESRISLESELSDEKQIYISTGLGGKNGKLRFYVLLLSTDNKVFEEYQRQVVEREFAYSLPKAECEIERLTIEDKYVELVFLTPVKIDIKLVLDRVIVECNQYGNFLSEIFTVTNVKELTHEEIEEIINKDGDSKTSN